MGEEEKQAVELSADLEKLYEKLTALTVKEAADLVKAMEERLGISAAAPAGAMMMAAPAGDDEGADEGQSTYDVIMTAAGDKKIQVIKEARRITGLGLKEAKALVDQSPGAKIKEGLPREEAEQIKQELEAAGATVELK